MSLAEHSGEAAAVAALLDTEHRTRMLAWAVSALRERRIRRAESTELTRCAAEFTKLSNIQMEYAKAVGAKRAVYLGALPSLAGVLALLEENLVAEAVRESARLRGELAPVIAEARRRLHGARG
jgi:hypothetical protein